MIVQGSRIEQEVNGLGNHHPDHHNSIEARWARSSEIAQHAAVALSAAKIMAITVVVGVAEVWGGIEEAEVPHEGVVVFEVEVAGSFSPGSSLFRGGGRRRYRNCGAIP